MQHVIPDRNITALRFMFPKGTVVEFADSHRLARVIQVDDSCCVQLCFKDTGEVVKVRHSPVVFHKVYNGQDAEERKRKLLNMQECECYE